MNITFAEAIRIAGLSSYKETQFNEDFTRYYGNDGLMSTAKEAVLQIICYCADQVNLDEYKIQQIIEMVAKRKAELKNHESNLNLCENIAEELLEDWRIATY